jgi:hypothetical protein
MKGKRREWVVECYDSTELLYKVAIPESHITDDMLKSALRILAAKAGLTPGEILAAHKRRDRPNSQSLLEVTRSNEPFSYMCGSNPYVIACLKEVNMRVKAASKTSVKKVRGRVV